MSKTITRPLWHYRDSEVETGTVTNWAVRPISLTRSLYLNLDSARDPKIQVPVLHAAGCFHAKNAYTHPWWQKVPSVLLPALVEGERSIWAEGGLRPRNLAFCIICILEQPIKVADDV